MSRSHIGLPTPEVGRHPDLFGPLIIQVTLHGRAKTKIVKSNGNSRTTHRGRAPLLYVAAKIYDDSFQAAPNSTKQFPFSLSFPDSVDTRITQAEWKPSGWYSTESGNPLPPSFMLDYHGFVHRFTAFTEYRVGTTVRMPNIDIKVGAIDEHSEPAVMYERPRIKPEVMLQRYQEWKESCKVQNEHLVPEDDRASGFKQKAKAMFSSNYYPEYHFDIHTKYPCQIYLGQPMTFEIRVRPKEDLCTAPVNPDITMCAFNADIHAHTEARAETVFFTHPESSGNECVAKMTGRLNDSKAPFSKESDYTKVITTPAVLGMPTSFSTFNICRRYTLELKYTIIAATKPFKISRIIPIVILPPLDLPSEAAVAGPSSRPMQDSAAPLPQYERPPEYHEVVENDTQAGGNLGDTGSGRGKAAATA